MYTQETSEEDARKVIGGRRRAEFMGDFAKGCAEMTASCDGKKGFSGEKGGGVKGKEQSGPL